MTDSTMRPEDEIKTPDVNVTVSAWADGRRNVNAVDAFGKPLALGQIRLALREALQHIEDKFASTLAEATARKLLEEMVSHKDGNGVAKFLHRMGLR